MALPLGPPHGCGEKDHDDLLTKLIAGSSPRVWGKDLDVDTLNKLARIIPTGVGKSNGFVGDFI